MYSRLAAIFLVPVLLADSLVPVPSLACSESRPSPFAGFMQEALTAGAIFHPEMPMAGREETAGVLKDAAHIRLVLQEVERSMVDVLETARQKLQHFERQKNGVGGLSE